MLGCADPETRGPKVHVVIPRAEESRSMAPGACSGLRGSGSKDLVARDIFVPAYRAIDTRVLFGGTSPHARNHASNLYRLSAEAMLSNSVATAVLAFGKIRA